MNSLLVSVVLIVTVLALASARGPGGPGGPHGGPGGPGGHRGHGPPGGPGGRGGMLGMFPSCQTLNDALKKKHQELWKAKQIGPEANNCEATDHKECMIKDMNTVRCAVQEQPTQECMDEMMSYLQASACDSENESNDP